MNKSLAMLLIGLFFGAGGGYVAATSTGAEHAGHGHGTHNHDAHDPCADTQAALTGDDRPLVLAAGAVSAR